VNRRDLILGVAGTVLASDRLLAAPDAQGEEGLNALALDVAQWAGLDAEIQGK
jgi:hypothetical protein